MPAAAAAVGVVVVAGVNDVVELVVVAGVVGTAATGISVDEDDVVVVAPGICVLDEVVAALPTAAPAARVEEVDVCAPAATPATGVVVEVEVVETKPAAATAVEEEVVASVSIKAPVAKSLGMA